MNSLMKNMGTPVNRFISTLVGQKQALNIVYILLILSSCSTTINIPEGELLYTGIRSIEIVDMDSMQYEIRFLNGVKPIHFGYGLLFAHE